VYAALRLVAALLALLPRSALPGVGSALGWFAGSIVKYRRALVEQAIERAGIPDERDVARRMYRDLGRGIAELLWLAGASAARRNETIAAVTIDDDALAALDRAVLAGPVVIFASHTGNWELAAAAAAQRLARSGRRLAVVAKRMHVHAVDRFIRCLRADLGLAVSEPTGALAAARRALAAGDVVAMPIDQVPDRAAHGTKVLFLGAPALVDRAPATLARRSGATVLVVAAERDGARHRVHVLDVLSPDADATAAATARLDAFVRGSPASWLWLHRRWKTPSDAAARRPRALVAAGQAR
jgi:KDO2-lipid IV(A) lauroyltransferase